MTDSDLSAKTKQKSGFTQNFRLQVFLRIFLLILTITCFLWLVMNTALYATITIIGLVCLAVIWNLVYYVEQTNRHLVRFLESVKYADTVHLGFGRRLGGSFQELTESFTAVVQDFERIRHEKEEQYLALQTILHHVSIGLISLDNEGNIDFINPAAKRLLNLPYILHISSLGNEYQPLVQALQAKTEQPTSLVKLVLNDEILQLSLNAAYFRQRNREMTLFSIQNIVSELEEQEILAWQKLIRVLTHEIMNSIAPITSLAETVNGLLSNDFPTDADEQHELLHDIRSAAQTISRRSEGLLSFVENYRKLSRIPEPDFASVRLTDLFRRLLSLFAKQGQEKNIIFETSITPDDVEILGDNVLLEQVFINLIQNAIHAVSGTDNSGKPRKISLKAESNRLGRAVVHIDDTGTGIVPEAMEKIFVPFFTTKPDGSGIGLSLTRQILRKHGASITVSSVVGEGTSFQIRF